MTTIVKRPRGKWQAIVRKPSKERGVSFARAGLASAFFGASPFAFNANGTYREALAVGVNARGILSETARAASPPKLARKRASCCRHKSLQGLQLNSHAPKGHR